ncbi:DUF4129 domain-containing protein [Chloroflexota bacterium]
MMNRSLVRIILVAVVCAALLYLMIPLDFMLNEKPSPVAFIPHEDPETVKQLFGDTHPPLHESEFFNLMLQVNSEAEIEALLRKRLPFPQDFVVPRSLKQAINDFTASGINVSHMWVEIHDDIGNLEALKAEFRLAEAIQLTAETSARISQANNELERINRTGETVREVLKVSAAPVWSDLEPSYDEMMGVIDRMIETLDLRKESLAFDFDHGELQTGVTLNIEPTVAWVGDNVRFWGILSSEEKSIAGREVDILLNSSHYVTAKTNAYGYYQGWIQVPHWYILKLDLQVLYSPNDEDVGLYKPSLSPVSRLNVLFYETELQVTVENNAYPGLETTVNAKFDYGESPPLNEREVEIYFDDVLISEVTAQEAFAQEIEIDTEADVGKHVIRVSAPAAGRYEPVDARVFLNITRATPILDISIPKVAMIPSSVGLEGKLYSDFGPLVGASIIMKLGKSRVESVSSEDGAFDTEIKAPMGFSVIGSQDLVIQVLPHEPWHAPLNITSSVLMVNVVNCSALVAILLFLGIYLPSRLRRWGAYRRRTTRPAIAAAPSEPAPEPEYNGRITALTSTEDGDEASGDPRDRIFYWYRLAARLLGRITEALLQPQQTLREFAEESTRVLGTAAKYFVELTAIIERLLYSQYRPIKKDVEDSMELSNKVQGEAKLRVATEPLLAHQSSETGIGGARVLPFGIRVDVTSPWRQLSTWFFVLLILGVAYYACILLFLLPLLIIASTAP